MIIYRKEEKIYVQNVTKIKEKVLSSYFLQCSVWRKDQFYK